jgi:methyl-accepting chemotaxis protein
MNFQRGWLFWVAVSLAVTVLAALNAIWEVALPLRLILAVVSGVLPMLGFFLFLRSRPPQEKDFSQTIPLLPEYSPTEGTTLEQSMGFPEQDWEAVTSTVKELDSVLSHDNLIERMSRLLRQLENFFNEQKEGTRFIYENVIRTFEISDNLANTAKEAFELSERVQKGVKVVTDSLNQSQQLAELLFSQSRKISKILTIMSDISEKIHILSINASIVSARAGMSGKGFEVVAKEIRNLAKETENSLLEIENVIAEVQNTIQNVNEKVELAHKETETEKSDLLAVAGSLQGVILAVEIIRAVSNVAKEKGEEQVEQFNKPIVKDLLESGGSLRDMIMTLKNRVKDLEKQFATVEEEAR